LNRPSYRVEISRSAQRHLRRLPPGDAARLRGPILAVALDPRPPGVVRLVGSDLWRLRLADLRVVYIVDDAAHIVVVLKVARRSESTYRRVDR
jgi:mRNA interferase RelE/StbE